MSIVEKALWLIEQHRDEDATLGDLAAYCGVTAPHLARAFAETFGIPPMEYRRARRLTEAARALVRGREDVTQVALGAGYATHEGFSRAFKAAFGVTPSALRATKTLADLPLTFPPSLEAIRAVKLAPPRFATRPAFRLAGLRRRFARSQTAGIPGLWAEFWPHIGEIDGQRGREAFGVCLPGAAPEIDYLAAVEVAPDTAPLGLETYDAPAARYAVYARRGHATEIRSLFAAIYDHGLKNAGADYVDGPGLERYDHRFDPIAGEGRFELWIPVAAGR